MIKIKKVKCDICSKIFSAKKISNRIGKFYSRDGYNFHNAWLCNDCLMEVINGIPKETKNIKIYFKEIEQKYTEIQREITNEYEITDDKSLKLYQNNKQKHLKRIIIL